MSPQSIAPAQARRPRAEASTSAPSCPCCRKEMLSTRTPAGRKVWACPDPGPSCRDVPYLLGLDMLDRARLSARVVADAGVRKVVAETDENVTSLHEVLDELS